MTATVSVRGQVVIPAEIRKKYHIKPKTKVDFVESENRVYLVPVPKHPFKAAYGMWKHLKGISSNDVIKMRREERKKEAEKYKRLYGIR